MRTRGLESCAESCAPSMRKVSSASFLRHDLLDDAGGVAADHHIVRHILRDHGSGGNDGIPADGDAVVYLALEQFFQQALVIGVCGLPGRDFQA